MKNVGAGIIALTLMASVVPLMAHHSFSAEFDVNKPISMDGKVTLIRWANPHVTVAVDVVDSAGRISNWNVQLNPPDILTQNGWKVDTLRAGMEVCVDGFPQKKGDRVFGSAAFTIKATGQRLKTPAGVWMGKTSAGTIFAQGEIPFTGSSVCNPPAR